VIHKAAPSFWVAYRGLTPEIGKLADKCFEVLKDNPSHPSLRLKKTGRFWSPRVGLHHRAVSVEIQGGLLWLWIGDHDEYDRLIG
jgi:hypothetical protein